MTDPVLVRLPGRSRYYARTDQGRTVPSVTTVVSLTPKPYLLNWVLKLAAEYAAANADELATLTYDMRVQRIKDEVNRLREEGATKGTAVHDYAEQYAWLGLARPPENGPEEAVVQIIDRLKPEVRFMEAMVWNGTVGYAGTLDGIWEVDWQGRRERWLIDWKTSKSRSIEWGLQLEAYRRAQTIFTPQGIEYPMPPIDRLVVLWVPFAGPWQALEVITGRRDWVAFLQHHAALRWHELRHIDDVFGGPLLAEGGTCDSNNDNNSEGTTA